MIGLALIAAGILSKHVAMDAPGERYAFIVGIDTYDDASIPKLDGAVADAKAVCAALIAKCGFKPENIVMLTSDARSPQLKATLANIQRQSTWFQYKVATHQNHNDMVFMYYAGHAVDIGGAGFLVPSDAKMSPDRIIGDQQNGNGAGGDHDHDHDGGDKPIGAQGQQFQFLPSEMNLLDAAVPFNMGRLPVKTIIAGFDMCRSDGWDDDQQETGHSRHVLTTALANSTDLCRAVSLNAESQTDANFEPPNVLEMHACQRGKCSYENNGRGYFSRALERALTTDAADANHDGVVDLDELKNYLEHAVPIDSDGKQTPYIEENGSDAGTTAIATVGHSAAKVTPVEVQTEVKEVETTTPDQSREVFQKGVWQALPGQQWCDVVSGEGGFSIRMPIKLKPDTQVQRDVQQVSTVDKDKKTFTSNLVSYYYQEQEQYLYFRFQASFADMPMDEYKDENQVLDWGEYLMKDKDLKGTFGGVDLDAFFKLFVKALVPNIFGLNLGGHQRSADTVEKVPYQVGEFPGRRFLVRKSDGSFHIIQTAAIKNRLYIFQEQYEGGEQNTPFQQGYFVESLNFFDDLLQKPDDMIPIFDSGV